MKSLRARGVAGASVCGLLLWIGAGPAAAQSVDADLVEQNHSGVQGTVTLTVTDAGDLRVRISAEGLVPGPHAQHLHGAAGGMHFACATSKSDKDGDGWLTNEEATGEYGNVFLALTTRGDTSAQSGLAIDRMPVADEQGRLRYDRTIPKAALPAGLLGNLSHLHVVQHGIDANGNGKYDVKALGESSFARSLGVEGVPEEATDPAACGMVTGVGAGHMPVGGVETGGGEAGPPDRTALGLLGVGLLTLAGGLELHRRRLRGAG
jgi:hypothetical protein